MATTENITDYLRANFIGYGGINAQGVIAAQSIPTGATYTKIIGFTHDDVALNTTPRFATNDIVLGLAGDYSVDSSISFSSGSNNIVWDIAFFVDGVLVPSIVFERKTGTLGDVGAASASGLLPAITAGQVVDIRVRHDDAGSVNFTAKHINIHAELKNPS